jgi:hypothetical protein
MRYSFVLYLASCAWSNGRHVPDLAGTETDLNVMTADSALRNDHAAVRRCFTRNSPSFSFLSGCRWGEKIHRKGRPVVEDALPSATQFPQILVEIED